MINARLHITFFCCFFFFSLCAQENDALIIDSNNNSTFYGFDESTPVRVSFYSAVFPGLGQIYNKKYWYIKLPIIYGSLGAGIYNYSFNNTNFKRVRKAYQSSINGQPHEFDGVGNNLFLSDESLISAQKIYKNNKDLSLIITVGIYILQILEANVAAHLLHHDVSDDLSFRPTFIHDQQTNITSFGTALTFNF